MKKKCFLACYFFFFNQIYDNLVGLCSDIQLWKLSASDNNQLPRNISESSSRQNLHCLHSTSVECSKPKKIESQLHMSVTYSSGLPNLVQM